MVVLKREKKKQFSTFVKIANDDFECWIEDPRLKRSLDQQQALLQWEQGDSFPLNSWVAHWHQHWESKQTRLPRHHLYAYLQEPCYWTARKISSRFSTTNFDLADCFQVAFEKSDDVLHSFNPELGTSLSTYANRAFSNAIQDALSKHNEIQIASELSLLQRCTKKRLEKALVDAGLPQTMRANHQAAWQSFKAFYFPQTTTARNLASLDQEDWAMMVAYYEVLREEQNLATASEAELQTWLGNCVFHLRRYTAPKSLSLNAEIDDSEEFIEQLGSQREETMTRLLAQEQEAARQQQQQRITAVLQAGLAKLNPSSQQLLHLYYGEQLKQTEIAAQLGNQQYQVSRQLRTARQALLKALLAWSKKELHISFDSTVLNGMTVILEDWLTIQFSGERN